MFNQTRKYPVGIQTFSENMEGSSNALDQINSKGYALPYYGSDGNTQLRDASAGTQMPTMRKVVKVGVAFERDTMTVKDFKLA